MLLHNMLVDAQDMLLINNTRLFIINIGRKRGYFTFIKVMKGDVYEN